MTGQHHQPDQDIRTNQTMDLDTVLRRYLADPTASWGSARLGLSPNFPAQTMNRPASTRVRRSKSSPRGEPYAFTQPRKSVPVRISSQVMRARAGATCSRCVCPPRGTTMHRRTVLTECGPDHEALRPQDRAAVLFDLGLGTEQVDVCVRTADPEALAQLRAGLGRSLFEPDNPLMPAMPRLSPHRVFVCRFARLEVYQRIPSHGETPPEGPHTHVLPHLLRHQRTHPATAPIPEGWVPCLSLYPANPMHDALGHPRPFDSAAYEGFQTLLRGFGDPVLVRLKEAVTEAVRADQAPDGFALPASRAERAMVRVALRQLTHTDGHRPVLAAWRQAFDRMEETAE